jgi:hypothetical protein
MEPGKSRTRKPAPADPTKVESAIEVAKQRIRADSALSISAIVKLGVPRPSLPDALGAFGREGFEVTKKLVRVPLASQILERVARGASATAKDLAALVVGGSKKEFAEALAALVASKNVALVVRTKETVVVGGAADVLAAHEIDGLERSLVALQASLKLVRKHRASLLRADVARALSDAVLPPAPKVASDTKDIAVLVERHSDPSGLTFVPAVVRAVGGEKSVAWVHSELLRGFREGRFELRPESGLGRLSEEDLRYCIPGPQGSKLSWVRAIANDARGGIDGSRS